MDAATLSSGLDIVAPACGQTLSVSEKAAVETSLPVLKANNGFDTVVFWGRISGISADYLIAQGYSLPYAMIDATTSPAVSFFRCAFLEYGTEDRAATRGRCRARAHQPLGFALRGLRQQPLGLLPFGCSWPARRVAPLARPAARSALPPSRVRSLTWFCGAAQHRRCDLAHP